eukprot:TRINITY_DN6942_c0_g1_i1.p1 TRINITY_DN6942_c0_g1~~TRINITY_DN6942_c0_g1_i1.p1  ORF type:complete len:946 (+),score=293.55 TRINITY_DN6942_c0_g1_i1:174-3011(+)
MSLRIKEQYKGKVDKEKPRSVPLDVIPDNLGGAFYSFDRLDVLSPDGYVVVRYKNTGTLVVGNIFEKDVKTFKVTSALKQMKLDFPFVFAAYDNDTFHVIEALSGSVDRYEHSEKDRINKTQCILSNDKYVIAVFGSGLLVWDRVNLSNYPRELALSDVRDPSVRPIINVQHNFSAVVPSSLAAAATTKVVLGNSDVFQVWEIDVIKQEMWMTFEARNESSTVKYLGLFYYLPTVITNNRTGIQCWNITKLKTPPVAGVVSSKEGVAKEIKDLPGILTCAYMDEVFLIVGDSLGNVGLRHRYDAESLYYLNAPESAVPKEDGGLLDHSLSAKVNCIEKVGRWVCVGFENSRVCVYDITKDKGEPVVEYVHPRPGSVRGISIQRAKGWLLITIKESESTGDLLARRTIRPGDVPGLPSTAARGKPHMVCWTPKLPGFEFYAAKTPSATDSGLTVLLAHSVIQIMEYLSSIKAAGEDVIEFTATIDRVKAVVDKLKKPDINVNFGVLRPLQATLDDYEAYLDKLTRTGSLMRFFTSSRLRRDIEVANTSLHKELNTLEDNVRQVVIDSMKRSAAREAWSSLGSSGYRPSSAADMMLRRLQDSNTPFSGTYGALMDASPTTIRGRPVSGQISYGSFNDDGPPSETNGEQAAATTVNKPEHYFTLPKDSMIYDTPGRHFWLKHFNEVLMIEWEFFIKALRQEFANEPAFDEQTEKFLLTTLDHWNTGSVSQYKFSEFLKGFGPFDKCIANVKATWSEKWFHGFLSSREAELLMKNDDEPDGTFLIRFSKSKPGSFALAFMKGGEARHILVESYMPDNFKISDQASSGAAKAFKSIDDIIDNYRYILRSPYTSLLPQTPWFHGDLSTEEATERLGTQRPGTYLIRFSSKGLFAASFVDTKNVVRHVLIQNQGKDHFQIDNGATDLMKFNSLQHLVSHYQERAIFKFPLKN